MHAAAVVRSLCALIHAVISNDAGDPKPIISKYFAASFGLRQAVFVRCAPRLHRGLIAEERQRQDFPGLSQALEAFNGDEAVDLLEDWTQLRGDIYIFFLAPDFGQTSKMTAIMLSLPRDCYRNFQESYHSTTRFVASNSSIIASARLAPAKLNRER